MMSRDQGEAANALADGGSDAMLRLATPPRDRGDLASSPAIRVLGRAENIVDLRNQIRNGTGSHGLLEAQVFTPPALEAFQREFRSIVQFVEIRESDLNEVERRRFDEINQRLFRDSPPEDATDD